MSFGIDDAQKLFKVGYTIYKQVQLVRANKKQCARLGERIRILTTELSGLFQKSGVIIPNPFNTNPQPPVGNPAGNPPGKVGGTPPAGSALPPGLNQPVFIAALEDLANVLGEILVFVNQFADKGFLRKMVRAKSHAEKFSGFADSLNECSLQLNLGISVQQLSNRDEDKADQAQDFQDIKASQEEILQANREILNQQKAGALSQAQYHQVQEEQMLSILEALKNLDVNQPRNLVGKIDEKLLVPYFDLRIDAVIQQGSFGIVYKGRWQEQLVAIKRIDQLDAEKEKEFVREVQIMSRLRSPHITQFYAACLETKRAALIMEYMANGSLFDYLKTATLNAEQKSTIIEKITRGLYYLHQNNVLHRDLKSANILLDGYLQPKISDFGLSKAHANSVMTVTTTSQAFGWLAPEFLSRSQGHPEYTRASDIYSLGVIIWEVLTGQVPYASLSDVKIVKHVQEGKRLDINHPAISKPYADVLTRCWHANPDERPSLEDILALLATHPIPELATSFATARAVANPGKTPDYRSLGIQHESDGEPYAALVDYQKAIEAGDAKAYTNLGTQLLQGVQDTRQAHRFFKQSAKADAPHPRGMYNLGYTYEKGLGTKNNVVKLEKARIWYQKAHEAGEPNAAPRLQSLKLSH